MWSDEAWKAIEDIYAKILDLEFVKELGDGSLDEKKFLNYIQQDKLYLDDYGRALALIAARIPTAKDAATYARFSQGASVAEQGLHDFYMSHIGSEAEEYRRQLAEAQKNVTCELYTSFLLKHAALSPVEVAAAAILPCFWIYEKVGVHHTAMLAEAKKNNKPHPFSRWIEMYSSPEFNSDTHIARDLCDKLAASATEERRREMTDAFVKASVMELMFWNAAWVEEKWIA